MNDSTAIALGREREQLVMWGARWELPGSRGRYWAGSAPRGLLPAQPSPAPKSYRSPTPSPAEEGQLPLASHPPEPLTILPGPLPACPTLPPSHQTARPWASHPPLQTLPGHQHPSLTGNVQGPSWPCLARHIPQPTWALPSITPVSTPSPLPLS